MAAERSAIRYGVKPLCSETRNSGCEASSVKCYMLSQWLETALSSAGISQAEASRRLSERLGRSIDRAAVNKMVKGTRAIAGDELIALGDITGITPPIDNTSVTLVPLLSWVSAGRMRDPGAPIPVQDVPLLAFSDLGRGDFFALKVAGDSMDRISPEGSIIIVNRAERVLQKGKPYVFSIRGETTYKMWEPDPVPRLEPRSLNMSHQPIFVQREADLEIVGRVRRTMFDL